jgi:L-lactate dehydrogenase complex protein LldG
MSPRAAGADPIDRFMVELQAVGGKAHRTNAQSLLTELSAFLRERSIEAVLAWEHMHGLDPAALMQAGFRIVASPNASVPAGITGCACAIAETGTLVLTTGSGQPMTASLLPEVHVAIVRSDQIVWTLEEALRMPEVRQSSTTVLVTGPSRTADIEMTLTIGVHGPRELVVYILD